MKITVSGSLGNIGQQLVKKLVAAGQTVTVITSNETRKKDIEALGVTAAIGSVSNAAFLTSAFTGADAVFCDDTSQPGRGQYCGQYSRCR